MTNSNTPTNHIDRGIGFTHFDGDSCSVPMDSPIPGDGELRKLLSGVLKINWPEISQTTKAGTRAEKTIDDLCKVLAQQRAKDCAAIKEQMPKQTQATDFLNVPYNMASKDSRRTANGMSGGFNEATDQCLAVLESVLGEKLV